jgi:pyruvate dehydrogenase E2 component (dihydrolipoamide acetyltransferase)
MSDFLMPALGADMEAGTMVEWLVKPGDQVSKGDIIAVVETQKGAIEVEIFDEGVVSEIVAPVGSKVPVGAPLARILASSKLVPKEPTEAPQTIASTSADKILPPSVPAISAAGLATLVRAKITPAARHRAMEIGINATSVPGTGVDGAVTIADVETAATQRKAPSTSRSRRTGFDPAEMRKAIAAAMSRSKREIPHYYLSHTVDVTHALTWLEAFNAVRPVPQRLLPAVLLLKASALALREVPQLNGTYIDGEVRPGEGIHVGWAISLRGGGIVAPAIRDTDAKSLPDLMIAMRDLVQRARAGGLRGLELTSPTITVTSLGDRGAETVTGIIYPPQIALIGFGAVARRPWAVVNRIEVRTLVSLSLAADHRATDGHIGSLLITAIDRLLQEPEKL